MPRHGLESPCHAAPAHRCLSWPRAPFLFGAVNRVRQSWRRNNCFLLQLHMKTRIGLVLPQPLGRSKTTFVEVADAKALAAELTKVGAKRAALFWRDRTGDGHTEGEPFAVSAVSEKHFKWAAEQPKDGMRALVCDTKG